MSTPVPVMTALPSANREIKLISHSPLFYWWPVWLFGFFMAGWTYVEDHRFAALPADTTIAYTNELAQGVSDYKLQTKVVPEGMTKQVKTALDNTKEPVRGTAFPVRVSQHAWLGSLFVAILVLVVIITNVPLRGLWSFLVIIMLIVIALFIHVLHGWDDIFERLGHLRIYINLAGYLTIATVILIVWLLAVFIFDRRSFVIFTPGQIRVCEHIGDSVRTYDTAGVTMLKQRDDLFRHYILGFGSGDLILKTAGADSHEIKMPNVLGIGWQLRAVEDMLRERSVSAQ